MTRAAGRSARRLAAAGRQPAETTIRRLERASGALATQSLSRMDEKLAWFRSMPADRRSWVGLVAQAGIAAFVEWMREPDEPIAVGGEVFGAAPRQLARTMSLHRTVELVKVTIDVVEENVEHLADPGEEGALREAVLRFSREVAFGAADVYARAAETRGSWDARLQALLVDALLRGELDEVLASRAAALGWTAIGPAAVAIGPAPPGAGPAPGTPGGGADIADTADTALDAVVRAGRRSGLEVLASIQGDRLILVLGGLRADLGDPVEATGRVLPYFGDGPVVVGHAVPTLGQAGGSARAATSGSRAVAAWPGAPRPVAAADLLPERVLIGDEEARRELVDTMHRPLTAAGTDLFETVDTYLSLGGALDATAKQLFVHPNTVRYRLRRVTDLCGQSPFLPRGAFVLRTAIALGRLD
jgi:hypothetical protein